MPITKIMWHFFSCILFSTNFQGFIRSDNLFVLLHLAYMCVCLEWVGWECVGINVLQTCACMFSSILSMQGESVSSAVLHFRLCLQTPVYKPVKCTRFLLPTYQLLICITFLISRSFVLIRFCGATTSIMFYVEMQWLVNLFLCFYVMCIFGAGLYVLFRSRCTSNQMPNKLKIP